MLTVQHHSSRSYPRTGCNEKAHFQFHRQHRKARRRCKEEISPILCWEKRRSKCSRLQRHCLNWSFLHSPASKRIGTHSRRSSAQWSRTTPPSHRYWNFNTWSLASKEKRRARLTNFEVIGSNFDVAWNALYRRYDKKRLWQAVQMFKLLNMVPVTQRSPSEYTRLLDTTGQCLWTFQKLRR